MRSHTTATIKNTPGYRTARIMYNMKLFPIILRGSHEYGIFCYCLLFILIIIGSDMVLFIIIFSVSISYFIQRNILYFVFINTYTVTKITYPDLTFTCSKSIIETLECVKYVQS